MIRSDIGCIGFAIIPTLLLAGCGSPQHQSARVLQDRLQAQLAPELANHTASIQNLPDGARVSLDETALFAPAKTDLNGNGRYTVASLIQALLDPRLMRIDVIGSPRTPDYLRTARIRSVENYVEAYSLGPPLQISEQPRTAASPAQGATVTIHVQCPPGPQGSTWGYPDRGATCN